jgi:hypothetical protein
MLTYIEPFGSAKAFGCGSAKHAKFPRQPFRVSEFFGNQRLSYATHISICWLRPADKTVARSSLASSKLDCSRSSKSDFAQTLIPPPPSPLLLTGGGVVFDLRLLL